LHCCGCLTGRLHRTTAGMRRFAKLCTVSHIVDVTLRSKTLVSHLDADGAHVQEHGKGLPDLVVQAPLPDELDEQLVHLQVAAASPLLLGGSFSFELLRVACKGRSILGHAGVCAGMSTFMGPDGVGTTMGHADIRSQTTGFQCAGKCVAGVVLAVPYMLLHARVHAASSGFDRECAGCNKHAWTASTHP